LQLSLQAASPETFGYTLVSYLKNVRNEQITELTGNELDDRCSILRKGVGMFLFAPMSRTALGLGLLPQG
jgi:hypothetical protein